MLTLLQWLFSLPPFLKEKFASYTDPARVFSLYEFDRCVNANTISLPESSRVAVVSGNYDEPELFFIGADRLNVDCLRFEEDPELWDLCKDWNSDDYRHVSASYDFVFCEQVLEHVPDPSLAFSNLCTLLKPGGYLHVSVPGINGVHGEPFYFYSGFHQRLLQAWSKREGLTTIQCSSWGTPKAARMYSCCDWSPLAISGGFLFQLIFLFSRLNILKLKRFLIHFMRYPFQSLFRRLPLSADAINTNPVIIWILAMK